jgi:hypothetical protein
MERVVRFQSCFLHISQTPLRPSVKFPGKWNPLPHSGPQRGPYWDRCLLLQISFTCPSVPPGYLRRAFTEKDARFQSTPHCLSTSPVNELFPQPSITFLSDFPHNVLLIKTKYYPYPEVPEKGIFFPCPVKTRPYKKKTFVSRALVSIPFRVSNKAATLQDSLTLSLPN